MKTVFLRDIADIQTGPFGSQLHQEDYVVAGTPIVTVEHLGKRRFTTQNLPMVSDADKQRLQKYILHKGDIVFSRVGSVDRCSFVEREHDGWMFSGRCLRVRPLEMVDSEYLYYYFCGEETKQFVRNIAVGATMPSINTKLLGEVPIALPDMETQKKIAAIVSSIDHKIEINEEINDNLLQQAMTLFVYTFVDNPPCGESRPLYGFADYINGAAFKQVDYSASGLPIIKIAELKNGITDSTQFFAGDKGEKYLIHDKDILFSWSGNPDTSIDIFIWASGDAILNQHTFNVKSKEGFRWFVYLMLKYFKPEFTQIASNKQTTGLGHVTASDLKRLRFIYDRDEISSFEAMIEPTMEMVFSNMLENRRLISLRDSLLPRLMSGDIDVSGIDL